MRHSHVHFVSLPRALVFIVMYLEHVDGVYAHFCALYVHHSTCCYCVPILHYFGVYVCLYLSHIPSHAPMFTLCCCLVFRCRLLLTLITWQGLLYTLIQSWCIILHITFAILHVQYDHVRVAHGPSYHSDCLFVYFRAYWVTLVISPLVQFHPYYTCDMLLSLDTFSTFFSVYYMYLPLYSTPENYWFSTRAPGLHCFV